MSKTYCICEGMHGTRTARGGKNGCIASVQSYDGSICIKNWYDDNNVLKVSIGTNEGSSCYTDSKSNDFIGTFQEFKDLLKLHEEIRRGQVSIVRHRQKKV